MRFITFTFVAVAVVAPSLASAQQGTAASSAAATNPTAPNQGSPDEVVCKVEPPETGTRLGARHECHSAREWQRMWTVEQQQLFKAQVQFGFTCGEVAMGGC